MPSAGIASGAQAKRTAVGKVPPTAPKARATSTSNLMFNIAGPSKQASAKPKDSAVTAAPAASSSSAPSDRGAPMSKTQMRKALYKASNGGKPIPQEILDMQGSSEERAAQAHKKRVVLGGEDEFASEAKREPGQYIAIDCEMVGVGPNGSESILARVSLVNFHGYTLLDTFVKPAERVTDYRTWVSGVRPADLAEAPSFASVQARVADLIKGRTLVGHALHNDLKALLLSHPFHLIRDTSTYKGFRDLARTKHPSLRQLAKLVLGIDIQVVGQEHSSVEDARATMALFRAHKNAWDQSLNRGPGKGRRSSGVEASLDLDEDEDSGGDGGGDGDADDGAGVASSGANAKGSTSSTQGTKRPRNDEGQPSHRLSSGPGKPTKADPSSPARPPKRPRVASQPNWWTEPL